MAYNKENFRTVKEQFEQKRAAALENAAKRRDEIHDALPETARIDKALAETGIKIMESAKAGADGINERIAQLRAENEALRNRRKEILNQNGYPADYDKPKFECEECSDSGYVGLYMCKCMKKALAEAGFRSSGISGLIAEQSFETFDLNYYNFMPEIREKMEQNYKLLYNFAHNFSGNEPQPNWLILGGTGLGKTHISTSVARVVIERGNDVVYETAQNIMSDFEAEKFKNAEPALGTSRYLSCDLLIIDDLGTELINQFTISCLYNIINTRLNSKKSMIINTNLTIDELRQSYADRITSRLFGEFKPIIFRGRDIRAEKLRRAKK